MSTNLTETINDYFSKSSNTLGCPKGAEHVIDTNNYIPIRTVSPATKRNETLIVSIGYCRAT